ncbi:unnamed protein product (macronuclear) [Paramecium tetraurelia]|uniref:Transmembrane protein n=1 Tax=Paramecium tetraurelia TaxID=5888 RepID=A0E743_PARTE|nr:uncharacterized protein GSPATT00023838001 [Paramecium tetraurelia]CAK91110.1 unnamed protein product [Paramecium tetraurelia]|eukprot:XP_001458507.1 hypothetical protein (macronuclear) [Paramecium tetraurelia strain d4-2]
MDAFLAHNHVIILTVAAVNVLLCLMPPYNQTIAKQSHFIDDNDDSIQESTTKVQRQNHKFQTEEEEEEENVGCRKSNQVQESDEQDEVFFRIYDGLKK